MKKMLNRMNCTNVQNDAISPLPVGAAAARGRSEDNSGDGDGLTGWRAITPKTVQNRSFSSRV